MSALMIATISVKDPEKFQRYLAGTQEVATPFGAALLYRGIVDKMLTGEDKDHRLAVIVEFPSLEKINEWYGSAAYQAFIALRDEAADIKMTSYEIVH